jgi:PST family polysaccharide transporter
MAADFYPRLTAVAHDDGECQRLVNEQTQISLVLAGPGVIGTLALAGLVMSTFYSVDFQQGVGLLRWICLGMTLRVMAWPLGFIVVAKGQQQTFFWTEVAATAVHVGLAWLLVPVFGVTGAGMSFFGLYIWHTALIYAIVRSSAGFRWSHTTLRIAGVFLPLIALVFALPLMLPEPYPSVLGVLVAAGSGLYSCWAMLHRLPHESVPSWLRKWVATVPAGADHPATCAPATEPS